MIVESQPTHSNLDGPISPKFHRNATSQSVSSVQIGVSLFEPFHSWLSFDSICLNCFQTLAKARTESELLEYDKRHICKPTTASQRAFDRRMLDGNKAALATLKDY